MPSWAYNSNVTADEYSLDKARELMDKAGYRYYILEKTVTVTEEGEVIEKEAGTDWMTVGIVGIVGLIVGLGVGYVLKKKE